MSLDFDRYSDTFESTAQQPVESTVEVKDELHFPEVVAQSAARILKFEQSSDHTGAFLPPFELFESAHRQDADQDRVLSPVASILSAINQSPARNKPIEAAFTRSAPDLKVAVGSEAKSVADENLRSDSLKRLADKNFDRLDKDHDGFISKAELDAAMVDPMFKGEDAQLVAALKSHRQELQNLSDDEWGPEIIGIHRDDIAEFSKLVSKSDKSDSETKLVGDMDKILWRSGQSLHGASHELFADKANPGSSVTPDAVKQGRLGDCYLMAAMAAVASTKDGKQAIVNMIKTNVDGTYTVTFPGDPDKPVTIQAPTDAELGLYAQGSRHGTWPAVLEKAYGKYCNDNNVDPHDGIRGGALSAVGLKLLTGRDIDTDHLVLTSKEETHRKLTEAMWHGRPVTAATRAEVGKLFGLADGLTDDAGIPGGHLYSIENYDPATRTLTIRNPWGRGEPMDASGNPKDGKDDGVFTMTLDEFDKNFMRVSYGER